MMGSEMPSSLVWSLCIKRLKSCLLSFLCNPYNIIPFLIYEIFSTCLLPFFYCLLAVTVIECNNNFLFFTSIILFIILLDEFGSRV